LESINPRGFEDLKNQHFSSWVVKQNPTNLFNLKKE